MKISIYNFKAIRELQNFDVKPFNIISGVNSSGKSSFVQFLLLLKQTIEAKSNIALVFNSAESISLGNYQDVVYRHDRKSNIGFKITLSKDEFSQEGIEYLAVEEAALRIEFTISENETPEIALFQLLYTTQSTRKKLHSLIFARNPGQKGLYISTATSGVFNEDFYQLPINIGEENLRGTIQFSGFYPQLFGTDVPNENYPELDKNPTRPITIEPRLENVIKSVTDFFTGISYLGPLRETPKDIYPANPQDRRIGSKGEYVAFILEKEAGDAVSYYTVSFSNDGLPTYTQTSATLIEAVNFWISSIFNLAKRIYAEQVKDDYVVKVVNQYDVETTIKHVGFGISQILPIVVEGLRLKPNGTLVLEQPEIHLHPRIQSLLFDFLYTLTMLGKRVVVETHSDHFIVRMRRRVAESQAKNFTDNFNLIFIEDRPSERLFRKLDLTELGSLIYFPENFLEQQDDDYRAIIKAQAIKKTRPQKD